MNKLKNVLENMKFEFSIIGFAEGFRDLLRKERALLHMDDTETRDAKLADVYQRLANGYAIRAKFGNDPIDMQMDMQMREVYNDLFIKYKNSFMERREDRLKQMGII